MPEQAAPSDLQLAAQLDHSVAEDFRNTVPRFAPEAMEKNQALRRIDETASQIEPAGGRYGAALMATSDAKRP